MASIAKKTQNARRITLHWGSKSSDKVRNRKSANKVGIEFFCLGLMLRHLYHEGHIDKGRIIMSSTSEKEVLMACLTNEKTL